MLKLYSEFKCSLYILGHTKISVKQQKKYTTSMLSYDIEEHGIKNITSKLGIKISDYDQNFKIICSLIKQYVNVKK